jgi:hypothetical protein
LVAFLTLRATVAFSAAPGSPTTDEMAAFERFPYVALVELEDSELVELEVVVVVEEELPVVLASVLVVELAADSVVAGADVVALALEVVLSTDDSFGIPNSPAGS